VSGPGEPGGAGAAELTARSGRFSLPVRVFGQGIPMIFLHGLGSDSRDSRRDLGELPGFRLALPDQRGHGGSRPRPDPGEFALDSMVGDLRATLAALDWPATVVAGGSMGAAVALRHVLTGPADCPALVLVAPALGPDRPDAAPLLTAIADRIDAVGLQQAVAELRGGAAAGERDGAAAGEGGGAAAGEGGGAAAGERDGAAAGERDGAAAGERDRGSATERDGGRRRPGRGGRRPGLLAPPGRRRARRRDAGRPVLAAAHRDGRPGRAHAAGGPGRDSRRSAAPGRSGGPDARVPAA
jgi:pimeloyl-ACP methyl ester carboxylesterase